jgi:hypothetical protein
MNGIYINGMSAAPKPGVANAQPRQRDFARPVGRVYRAPFSRVLDGLEFWVEVRKWLQGGFEAATFEFEFLNIALSKSYKEAIG